MSSPVAILILDDDLGFAMWLGRILNEAGFTAFPATRAEEALNLLQTAGMPTIDLLIANLALTGVPELLHALAGLRKKFGVVAIGDTGSAGRRKIRARLHRPKGRTAPSPAPYLKIIRKVL